MEKLGIFNRIWCDLSFISGNGFGGALCCFQGRNKSNNEGGAVEERERERVFAGESDCGGADETSPKVSISQLACSASKFYSVKLL